ncbi:hypothetical protein [Bradyrhizobium sp. ORS 285]|uniref:hypothetical protein n=1 Tax=Bradyrhizobium sp. ORS 285 TaxID=115808 RepID=UPI00055882DD|nr:hypothetical protein [Bradyrhizobium sp. ORS 285]
MSDLVSASSLFPRERRKESAVVLMAVLGLTLVLSAGILSIKTGVFDAMSTDDLMRLVEVRDWMNGQAWSDLHQYRLGSSGILMHWSRLVDLPLAASILLLKPLIGASAAEVVTLYVWPLLLLAIAVALAAAIARQMTNGAVVPRIAAAVLALLATPALVHFRPGAIDHHNAQIVLVLAMLLFAVQIERSAAKAAAAGFAASVSLAIGVEMLPAIAATGIAVAGLFIWRGAPVARQVSAFGLALAASSLGLALVLLPPGALALPVVDALGGPLLVLTVGGGAGLLLMVGIDRYRSGLGLRIVVAIGMAVALIGAFIALFPEALAAPYATLDPLVTSLWLERVQETVSLRTMLRIGPEDVPGFYALPAIAWVLAVVALVHSKPNERFRWVLAVVMLASLIAVSAWEMRGAAAAAMVAAPIFAAAAAVVWRSLAVGSNLVLLAFVVSPAMFGILGNSAKPVIDRFVAPSPVSFTSEASSCRSVSDAAPMKQLPRGRVMALVDLGPAILVDTDHSVFAGPYHRNNDGNLAMLRLMLASGPTAHQMLREQHVDYVVICRTAPNRDIIDRAPEGLEAKLVQGDAPDFLEPIELGSGSKISVWRVRE